jgi:hypothetical protein
LDAVVREVSFVKGRLLERGIYVVAEVVGDDFVLLLGC